MMGLFDKKDSIEQLEDRKEHLIIEEDITNREAEIAEKKAVISELKQRYGSDWKSTLGLKGKIDLQTLRSFAGTVKRGISDLGKAVHNPNLSPLPRRRG